MLKIATLLSTWAVSAFAIGAALACASGAHAQAQPANWQFLGNDTSGDDQWYVQPYVNHDGQGDRRLWVKEFSHQPGTTYAEGVGLAQINCQGAGLRFLQQTLFDANGEVTEGGSYSPGPWVAAPPGSIVAAVVNYACAR